MVRDVFHHKGHFTQPNKNPISLVQSTNYPRWLGIKGQTRPLKPRKRALKLKSIIKISLHVSCRYLDMIYVTTRSCRYRPNPQSLIGCLLKGQEAAIILQAPRTAWLMANLDHYQPIHYNESQYFNFEKLYFVMESNLELEHGFEEQIDIAKFCAKGNLVQKQLYCSNKIINPNKNTEVTYYTPVLRQ